MTSRHPIFAHYRAYDGPLAPDAFTNFIGAHFRRAIETPAPFEEEAGLHPPAPTESYFEWIDVLETARAAGPCFTMLEIGSGFGRWGTIGACAARQLGKRVHLGLVEADPQNICNARVVMEDNGIAPEDYRVFECAVAGRAGEAAFVVGYPHGANPSGWLGQAITANDLTGARIIGQHFGRDLWEMTDGWRFIRARQRPLSEILVEYGAVDLADFDVQGAEADAVEEAIAPLTEKVARLHIGTHGPEIEDRLRAVLSAAGWSCLRDYPCLGERDTEYGRIYFGDGVQTWLNPARA